MRHPIIREALDLAGLGGRGDEQPQIEITTLADIPAGTGLGSSGSFTTALLRALYAHRRHQVHPVDLAEQACHIEIDRLGEPEVVAASTSSSAAGVIVPLLLLLVVAAALSGDKNLN